MRDILKINVLVAHFKSPINSFLAGAFANKQLFFGGGAGGFQGRNILGCRLDPKDVAEIS